MTEDTAAQLREQIADALFQVIEKAHGESAVAVKSLAQAREGADALMPIVLARVEAAEATARRDALLEAADDWDAWPGNELAFSGWLRAQASTQGAAPPAACSCACHGPGGNDWTHTNPCCPAVPAERRVCCEQHQEASVCYCGRPVRLPLGQGAQSSGLNFTPEILQAHDEAMERIRESERAAAVATRDAVIGVQSSGHGFVAGVGALCWHAVAMSGGERDVPISCGLPQSDPIHHQRVPGQPGEQDTAGES